MDVFVTALICVIIVAICVYAVISYKKKIKSGCCGGDCSCDSQNKKVRKDKSDYAYKTIVYIDGMTCSHCKRVWKACLAAMMTA